MTRQLTKSVLDSDRFLEVGWFRLAGSIHSHYPEAVQSAFIQVDHLKFGILAGVWSVVHLRTAARLSMSHLRVQEIQVPGPGKSSGNQVHDWLDICLTLHHSSSPAFWNSSRYPKIFPLPVLVGGCQDRVTDALVKSMACKFTGGPGFTVTKDRGDFLSRAQ